MPAARTRTRRTRRSAVQCFYEGALSRAERADLPLAQDVDGIDEEIAVLRLRLRSALEQHPENMTFMLKGIALLVKALSAKYRLSKDAKADLSASIEGVLQDIGGRIYPEVFDDAARNADA